MRRKSQDRDQWQAKVLHEIQTSQKKKKKKKKKKKQKGYLY
jgi:hypothetical protein